ncbi:hypothetical protein L9F63_011519, partial [Diploptera punctata]
IKYCRQHVTKLGLLSRCSQNIPFDRVLTSVSRKNIKSMVLAVKFNSPRGLRAELKLSFSMNNDKVVDSDFRAYFACGTSLFLVQ